MPYDSERYSKNWLINSAQGHPIRVREQTSLVPHSSNAVSTSCLFLCTSLCANCDQITSLLRVLLFIFCEQNILIPRVFFPFICVPRNWNQDLTFVNTSLHHRRSTNFTRQAKTYFEAKHVFRITMGRAQSKQIAFSPSTLSVVRICNFEPTRCRCSSVFAQLQRPQASPTRRFCCLKMTNSTEHRTENKMAMSP